MSRQLRNAAAPILALIVGVLVVQTADAATTTGTALQAAYQALDDLAGGYGKQIIVLVAFITAVFGIIAMNATSVIVKYIGVLVFLSVGLGAGITLSGATI
jgi:hypothetical protein